MADSGRRDPRYRCVLPMVLKAGRALPVETEDVSYSGVFVVTPVELPIRQLVQIEAQLGSYVFHAHAMVVFARREGRGKAAGLGLKFFGLTRDTLERWVRFVREAREQEVPEVSPLPGPNAARAAVMLKVRPQGIDALIDVYTRDIADGGMFVETDQPLRVDSRLMAEIVHPETGEAFELECVVRRVVSAPRPGIGVEFTALDAERLQALHEFVASVAPSIIIEGPDEPAGDSFDA